MDGKSPELPTIDNFLDDLEEQLRDVDYRVISTMGHAPGKILTLDKFSSVEPTETRVSTVASFMLVPKRKSSAENIIHLPVSLECYVLWKGDIARKIDILSRDIDYAGMGDRGLKDFWFLTAVALVRCRVLFRTDWFPNAKLRTIESMGKHSKIFGDEAFTKLRQLSRRRDDIKRKPLEVDMQLTQLLVSSALDNDYSYSEALALLTSD